MDNKFLYEYTNMNKYCDSPGLIPTSQQVIKN